MQINSEYLTFPLSLGSCELFSTCFINFLMSYELRSHHSDTHRALECVTLLQLCPGVHYQTPSTPLTRLQPQAMAVLPSASGTSDFWLSQLDEHTQHLFFHTWLISRNKTSQFCACGHQQSASTPSTACSSTACTILKKRKRGGGPTGSWRALFSYVTRASTVPPSFCGFPASATFCGA